MPGGTRCATYGTDRHDEEDSWFQHAEVPATVAYRFDFHPLVEASC